MTSRGTRIESIPNGNDATALADFKDLKSKNVRIVSTARGDLSTGLLDDGGTVILRPSKDGRLLSFKIPVDEQLGKSDMDRIDRIIKLPKVDLDSARKLLREDGSLNLTEVARRNWVSYEIDDKAIFGDDAVRLAKAFLRVGSDHFFIFSTFDILSKKDIASGYILNSTPSEIEEFQGVSWGEINLDDCLMFNLPMTNAVWRPGRVESTRFVGVPEFILEMVGQE